MMLKLLKPGHLKAGKVYYLSPPETDAQFEAIYIGIRTAEKRIYTDALLADLPEIDSQHIHFQEWQIRKQTLAKLRAYLLSLKCPLDILDLGCGNGWMSRHLSDLPGCRVIGMDMNNAELQQGAQVFQNKKQLFFLYGNIFNPAFSDVFDIILLASCIQYFPDISLLIRRLQTLLKPRGEIHILDSPFYQEKGISAARQRSANYYKSIGFPEMAAHYHHHSVDDLKEFEPEILYRPGSFQNRLQKKLFKKTASPFPWLKIRP